MKKQIYILIMINFIAGCTLFAPSPEKQYSIATAQKPYDVIIVPGYPHQDGRWSDLTKARIYWAHYLYSKGIAKNVIFSGSAVYSPYVEAKIMAMYGEALGISKENIFIEPTAEHSTENLYYSYKLAQEKGFTNIALATDPFQNSWLRSFARKQNLRISFIPILFDTLKTIPKTDPVIDEEQAFVEDFVSLTERESFFERWKGTQGKKINY